MRYQELIKKEVVNCRTGKRIGYIGDLEIEQCSGTIEGIIVTGHCRCLSVFFPQNECFIRYCDIKCMGPDIILVDICDTKR